MVNNSGFWRPLLLAQWRGGRGWGKGGLYIFSPFFSSQTTDCSNFGNVVGFVWLACQVAISHVGRRCPRVVAAVRLHVASCWCACCWLPVASCRCRCCQLLVADIYIYICICITWRAGFLPIQSPLQQPSLSGPAILRF